MLANHEPNRLARFVEVRHLIVQETSRDAGARISRQVN